MTKNEARARQLVYERSDGRCEVCGQARAQEWQHRKNRSQGGKWEASNGLHVCSPCHRDIHSMPTFSDSNGWTVLSFEYPDEKPVKLHYGWVILDDAGDWTGLGGDPI